MIILLLAARLLPWLAWDLVARRAGTSDGRERKVVATQEGLAIVYALDAARERLVQPIVAQWDEQDWKTFVSLLRRFADDALALETP